MELGAVHIGILLFRLGIAKFFVFVAFVFVGLAMQPNPNLSASSISVRLGGRPQPQPKMAEKIHLHRADLFVLAYHGIYERYRDEFAAPPSWLAAEFFALHDLPKFWRMPHRSESFLAFLAEMYGTDFESLEAAERAEALEVKRIMNQLEIGTHVSLLKRRQLESPELLLVDRKGKLLAQGQGLFDMDHIADLVVTSISRQEELGRTLVPASALLANPLHQKIADEMTLEFPKIKEDYFSRAKHELLSHLEQKAFDCRSTMLLLTRDRMPLFGLAPKT